MAEAHYRVPHSEIGDLLAIHTVGWHQVAAKFIRWWTTSDFNHVAFCCGDDSVIEAVGGLGVVRRPIAIYARHKYLVLRSAEPMEEAQKEAMLAHAVSQLGKKYDFRGIVGFVWHRNLHNPQKWFCSELGRSICERGDLHPVAIVPEGLTAPQLIVSSVAFRVVDAHWWGAPLELPGGERTCFDRIRKGNDRRSGCAPA
jgi:hypothetical protein